MPLPINIPDLIERRVVENTRVDYKAGWNPESIIQTICAFANDIDNMGGGYIIIGVEDENGRPKLPVKGLNLDEIDFIDKDIINKCNMIEPRYLPIVEHTQYKGADVIVLWAPGGEVRPYKCPNGFPNDKKEKVEKAYYLRKSSSTMRANNNDIKELYALANTVPFDDRPNRTASIEALQQSLISSFLYNVKSELYAESKSLSLEQLAERMHITTGASETTYPRNVGLMFFNLRPDDFFPYTRIEVVDKPDPTGKGMSEKIFYGPLDAQLREALLHIRSYILQEKVFKHKDRAEADRFWNYPYDAIEEILANAVYHKSYEIREPIIVMVTPEKMEITSIPGPDRSITDEDMKNFRMIAKRLRNRRIGDYLKELDLIEGRNTGIATIVRAMKNNGSELPIFETDSERSYLTVTLPVHKVFINEPKQEITPDENKNSNSRKAHRRKDKIKEDVLCLLSKKPLSTAELIKELGYSQQTSSLRQVLRELLSTGTISYTNPDNKHDMFQKIRLSHEK